MKTLLQLCLFLSAGILLAGCSEDNKPEDPIFEKTNIRIYALNEMTSGSQSNGAINNGEYYLYIIPAYNNGNNCDLENETFVWIETFAGRKLRFSEDYEDEKGRIRIPNDLIYISHNNPYLTEYNRNCQICIIAAEEGTYDFALKFYQPKTGKYYITPRHRIKIHNSIHDWVIAETSKIE